MPEERVSTHHMGVMCALCSVVLVPDDCKCANKHGHTLQEANAWAAERWPEHPCFAPMRGPTGVEGLGCE